jgi:hypothetical protein
MIDSNYSLYFMLLSKNLITSRDIKPSAVLKITFYIVENMAEGKKMVVNSERRQKSIKKNEKFAA